MNNSDYVKVLEYIKRHTKFTPPILQRTLNLGFTEVREILGTLEEEGKVDYLGGIHYVFRKNAPDCEYPCPPPVELYNDEEDEDDDDDWDFDTPAGRRKKLMHKLNEMRKRNERRDQERQDQERRMREVRELREAMEKNKQKQPTFGAGVTPKEEKTKLASVLEANDAANSEFLNRLINGDIDVHNDDKSGPSAMELLGAKNKPSMADDDEEECIVDVRKELIKRVLDSDLSTADKIFMLYRLSKKSDDVCRHIADMPDCLFFCMPDSGRPQDADTLMEYLKADQDDDDDGDDGTV